MRGWRAAPRLLGAALALLLAAQAAQAQTSVTLVSNRGQSDDATSSAKTPRAQAFTTGSNAGGYKLTGVRFFSWGSFPTSANVRIESSGTDNKPGGSLGTLTLSNTGGIVTGTTTGIQLDPNTTYFVVMTGGSDAAAYIRTNSNSEDAGAAAGWSIGDDSLWDDDQTLDWDQTSTTSWQISIHGYATNAPPTVSGASYSPASITVDFNGTFNGCADLIAWSFKVDGGAQTWPRAVRCEGQSVKIIPDGLSDVPRIEAARSLTVSYHRGLARSAARSTPFCHPPRGCRAASSELKGTNGVDVASFTDFPVTGLKPRLVSATADGATLTLTFDQTLDPASRPFRTAFHVTVNGERRLVAAGGIAVAGKTVTLTLASAVAAGDAVRVRYTNLSHTRTSNRTLKGASRLMVDSFEHQTADNPRVIWSATLTVAEVMTPSYTFHGCFAGVEGKECSDLLTQSSFTSGGTSYEIRGFSRNYGNLSLQILLDRPIPRGWTWHVEGQRFPVANAQSPDTVRNNYRNVHFDWAAGQQVSVCLTTGSSATGRANPCPASTTSTTSDAAPATAAATLSSAFVVDVAMASSAGADKTYGEGDTIRVRVDFALRVEVTGTPRLKIDMDPANWGEKWATYESGSGTSSLTFAHTVVEPNYSSQGIAVLENSLELNGGTIRAGGADATLAHDGRDHDANHKVNWEVASDTQGGSGGSGGSGNSGGSGSSGPPTVSGVKVVSDPGDDDTYLLGDTIRIRATFSEAVTVTGSPRLSIDMSPEAWGTKQAAYASGSGTGSLDFTWTVVEPNYAPQGIAVLANSLALNGGTIRSAATSANAALAHTGRGHDTGHKVDWRPSVSVADASANEGTDANAAFTVSLSRAFTTAGHRVTVDYATADGTATAGADYTATSGTLTFAAGEKTKTVNVPVLDDAVDEGEETFVLRLSNVQGARAGDLEATGTISNDDPLQKMWLSRFGRTVADHVTGAVSDRLANPLTGAQVTVAGQTVNLAETQDDAFLGRALTSIAQVMGAPSGPAAGGDPGSGSLGTDPTQAEVDGWPGTGLGAADAPTLATASARSIAGRELLLGSAFHLAMDGGGGGPDLAAWGRATAGGFDGEAPADGGTVRVDGEVMTGILGTDATWDRLLAGVAVSVSEGEGTFDQPGVDAGTVESTMTTVSPYARFTVGERVTAWGLAGIGTGDMTIVQAANENTGQPERVARTDLEMRLAALGGRGALLQADEAGGFDLGLRADAFWVETEAEAVSNEGGTTADASRVRLALEGSRTFQVGGGALTPGLELGVRHDGGNAETGTGVELGGRVSYTDPGTGFSVEAQLRALIAHEDSDYEEWGASGAVRLAPGASGRGLAFSLAPSWGAPSGGIDRLWRARDARGLASAGGRFEPESRLAGEIGYGIALPGGYIGTPNLGFGRSGAARDWRIGWRLTPAGAAGFEVNLDATRRAADPSERWDVPVEHGVLLRGAVRW